MAASVKIEFDDGSRVISQTLEEATGVTAARGSKALSWDHRHPSCSMDDFYEIPRTTKFIANGNFQRVALQFPDPLLREAPEVVWTLQARVRKLKAAARRAEGEETEPLIFVTGDTSYGSCCVDEVSAQHLKADAIIHYGRACLSPTNSSVPVLYVFGRGKIRVEDLADTLLSGPLSPTAPTLNSSGAAGDEAKPPVLLLYDVTYAHAIPDLLKALGEEATRDGKLVVGFPTPEAYSPLGTEAPGSGSGSRRQAGCGSGAATSSAPQGDLPNCRSEGQRTACFGADAAGDRSSCSRGSAGAGGEDGSCRRSDSETPAMAGDARPGSPPTAEEQACPPRAEIPAVAASGRREEGTEQSSALLQAARQGGNASKAAAEGEVSAFGPPMASSAEASRRRVRIGGLGVELDSEESLKRHALFFVGGEGRQLSNVLLRCAGCVDRMRYDPSLPEGERLIADTGRGNKDLNRRYYLVQRAKEAGVVGIVVGTLGVQRYSSVVRSLRKMIEDAGRKAYTLAVGKVNVAKLANFAEVDVFCLVACAENSLLDSREFHAPVVTPLELEVALGKREWDGFYSTDFDDLRAFQGAQQGRHPLPPPPSTGANDPGSPGQPSSTKDPVTSGSAIESLALGGEDPKSRDRGYDSDGDRPFFSLITGGFKSNPGMARAASTPAAACLAGSEGSGALVGIGDRSLVEWSSPAADFLGQREFQGLEALKGQTEAKPATEGQSGIASDYGGV